MKTTCSQLKWVLVICLAFAASFVSSEAQALDIDNPAEQQCRSFQSAQAYANAATLYCLKQRRTAECHRQAAQTFQTCGFQGKYRRLAEAAQGKILIMALLTSSVDIAKQRVKPVSNFKMAQKDKPLYK